MSGGGDEGEAVLCTIQTQGLDHDPDTKGDRSAQRQAEGQEEGHDGACCLRLMLRYLPAEKQITQEFTRRVPDITTPTSTFISTLISTFLRINRHTAPRFDPLLMMSSTNLHPQLCIYLFTYVVGVLR